MKASLYIVWRQAYEFGIPIIDEQHRGIVSTINSLHYFIKSGRGDEIIEPVLTMLEQYADIHFKTEEELCAETNYPALEEHIALHKELVEKTERISARARIEKDPDVILAFLKEWWLEHIDVEDRKYASFLQKSKDTEAF